MDPSAVTTQQATVLADLASVRQKHPRCTDARLPRFSAPETHLKDGIGSARSASITWYSGLLDRSPPSPLDAILEPNSAVLIVSDNSPRSFSGEQIWS